MEDRLIGIATNEKEKIGVLIDNPTYIQKIRKKTKRVYKVRKYTNLDQNIRITKILNSIPEFHLKDKSESEMFFNSIQFVEKYTDKVVDIIAILFKEKDKKFLLRNLGNKDMQEIIFVVIQMIDFEDFMITITTCRNKVSLKQSQ